VLMEAKGTLAVEFGTLERVEWHLDNWSRWMDSGRAVDGYDSSSSGVATGGNSQHFDDMVEASDRRCAQIVNTIIDDLPVGQQAAIYHRYLAAVYRMNRNDLPAALAVAKLKIGASLKAKGVW
jgi:hypothetical protein